MLVNENILDKDETIPCTSYAILAKVKLYKYIFYFVFFSCRFLVENWFL